MGNNSSHYIQSAEDSAQQVRLNAEAAAESMAVSALAHCNAHFESTMSEGAALWVQQKCDPSALAKLGQTSAALVNTGRRKAALELALYLVIFCSFGGTGLWMIAAPVWAFVAGVPVSASLALFLSLSDIDGN